jgi:CheY-like chemotaxis protein
MNKPLVIQVEDDPNDVFLFDRAFKKSGIAADLKAFVDGEDLISFLTTQSSSGGAPPSLILLDIKLPRKSGFEVLQWVRAHPVFRRLPVVMLTSSAQPHDVRRAYDTGANGYLVKPMDIDEMTRLLTAVHGFWLVANISATGTDVPHLTPSTGNSPSI